MPKPVLKLAILALLAVLFAGCAATRHATQPVHPRGAVPLAVSRPLAVRIVDQQLRVHGEILWLAHTHCHGGEDGSYQHDCRLWARQLKPFGTVAAPFVGEVFNATTGKWLHSPTSYSYQWERCLSGTCSAISGETTNSYTVATADEGHKLRVAVTATNAYGSATAHSAETGEVPGSSGEEEGVKCEGAEKCFYVNYEAGNDAHTGLTEAEAWQHAPGMNGCTSVCLKYVKGEGGYKQEHGDEIIFKGGVTWPNSVFPLVPTGEGSSGHRDYFGVKTSWHTGGSFTKPIFNAENKPTEGPDARQAGKEVDALFDSRGGDYYVLEGINFKGFRADHTEKTYEYGECGIVIVGGGEHNLVNHIYVHEAYIDGKSFEKTECAFVAGTSGEQHGTELDNSTIEGDGKTFGIGVLGIATDINNVIKKLGVELEPRGHGVIAGNNISECAWINGKREYPSDGGEESGQHLDLIQENGLNGNEYYYDNVLHDAAGEGSGGKCEILEIGNPNHAEPGKSADYVWDNVIYGLHETEAPTFPQNGGENAAGEYWWNNTIEATTAGHGGGGESCIRAEGEEPKYKPITVVIENNLCVSTKEGEGASEPGKGEGVHIPSAGCGKAEVTCTVNHNLFILNTSVSADHYASYKEVIEEAKSSYLLAPLGGAATGIEQALNLTAECSGELASLCKDTTYGNVRSAKARPTEPTKWDAGAYQH